MSSFRFTVTVELNRESGKFASREELAEQLTEALESANPGSVDGVGADSDSTYAVDDWSVEEA